jgi:hypothetical protein
VAIKFKPLPIPTHDNNLFRDSVRLNSLGSLFFFANYTLKKERLRKLHYQMCKSFETEDLHLVLEEPMGHFKTTVGIALSMWLALPFTERDEFMMREWQTTHCGKSEQEADAWIRWMKFSHDQNTKTLVTHEIEGRAIDMGKEVDEHYVNNDLFRFVFNDILPGNQATWNDHSKFQRRLKGQSNIDATTGTFEYRGVGQALQGIHPLSTIQDDNMGRAAQESMLHGDGRVLEALWRWHCQLTTRIDTSAFDTSKVGRQLVIGNRWGHDDLNSRIKKNQPDFRFETHSAEGGCCRLHPNGVPIFPEEWSMERLQKMRSTLGAYDYCFPPNAPVLLADWTEKQISQIVPGDVVVGYKPGATKSKRQQRWHLVKSKVLATGTRRAWVVRVKLASGREVLCTKDHKWFVANSHRGATPYLPPEVGRDLVSVYTPSPVHGIEEQRYLDWLGGLMDGEGSCNPSSLNIAQSESKNPEVCAMIELVCTMLKIPFHRNDKRISPAGKEGYSWNLHGGRSLLIRMVQNARMAKRQRFVDKLWARPGRVCEESGLDRIVSIEPVEEMTVYNITTETGNFVAYGYATKNSHFYLNVGVLPEECIFQKEWLRYYRFKQSRPDLALEDMRNHLLIEHEVYNGQAVEDIPAGILHKRMIVDLNHAKKRSRCNHVILVVGWDPERDRLYVLHVWAKNTGYGELVDQIYKVGHRWQMSDMWLETVAAQNLMQFYIEERNRRESRPIYVNELPYDNSENAKRNRIEAEQPLYRNGQVWLARGFCEDFEREYLAYPASATLDVLDTFGYVTQTLGGIRQKDALDFVIAQQQGFAERRVGGAGY